MGGFVNAASNVVKELAEPLMNSIKSDSFNSVAGDVTSKAFRSLRSNLNSTEVGKDVADMFQYRYFPTYDKLLTELAKKNPSLNSMELSKQAKNGAVQQTFGRNHAVLAQLMAASEKQHGSFSTKVLMDHVAMILDDSVVRETVDKDIRYRKDIPPKKMEVSESKYNVDRNLEYNATLRDLGRENQKVDRRPVKNHYGDELAHTVQGLATTTLAPAIAFSHLSTTANVPLDFGLKAAYKSLLDNLPTTHAATKQFLLDSGVFSHTMLTAKRENEIWKNGKIAQRDMSVVGRAISKMIHAPLFAPLRDWQISFAASAAYHATIQEADNYYRTQSKRSLIHLQNMGLNPTQVIQQKGILTEEQLTQAIYQGTDQSVFLHPEMNRSYYSHQNNFIKLQGMFHSYVTSEGKFVARVLKDTYKSKDPAKIATTLAMLAVAYPVVGELIKKGEMYLRGQWQEANNDTGFHKLVGDEGLEPMVSEWFDTYGHMATVGVYTSYLNSALSNNLAKGLMGPIYGTIAQDATDVIKLDHSLWTGKGAKSNSKQLAKDYISQGLPLNIGKILSHQLLPSAKEEKLRNPSKKPKTGIKSIVKEMEKE